MQKIPMVMAAAFLLTGCASYEIKTTRPVPASAEMTQPAAPLPDFKGQNLGQLVNYTSDLRALYKQTADQLDALIAWAKQTQAKP